MVIMKKYEFKVEKGDYFSIDGDQEMIAYMAKDGWEFIHAMYVPPNDFTRLYFRREIK